MNKLCILVSFSGGVQTGSAMNLAILIFSVMIVSSWDRLPGIPSLCVFWFLGLQCFHCLWKKCDRGILCDIPRQNSWARARRRSGRYQGNLSGCNHGPDNFIYLNRMRLGDNEHDFPGALRPHRLHKTDFTTNGFSPCAMHSINLLKPANMVFYLMLFAQEKSKT